MTDLPSGMRQAGGRGVCAHLPQAVLSGPPGVLHLPLRFIPCGRCPCLSSTDHQACMFQLSPCTFCLAETITLGQIPPPGTRLNLPGGVSPSLPSPHSVACVQLPTSQLVILGKFLPSSPLLPLPLSPSSLLPPPLPFPLLFPLLSLLGFIVITTTTIF